MCGFRVDLRPDRGIAVRVGGLIFAFRAQKCSSQAKYCIFFVNFLLQIVKISLARASGTRDFRISFLSPGLESMHMFPSPGEMLGGVASIESSRIRSFHVITLVCVSIGFYECDPRQTNESLLLSATHGRPYFCLIFVL